jgi:hypothetical protein
MKHFMHKIIFFSLFLFVLTTFCHSQNRYYVESWAQKLFLNFNLLYDYEKLSSTKNDFYIGTNNLLFELALGYDFGRIVPRISFDVGLPLSGVVNFIGGKENITEVMDTKNFKLGLEIGLKLIKTQRFDMIIPFGTLFCWTTYTQKNPNYTSGHPFDRIWDYSYINLFSGIDALFQINRHFRIGLLLKIEFPVKKEFEYKEVLRGNYIWADTGNNTYSIKQDVNVISFSIGIGVLANL